VLKLFDNDSAVAAACLTVVSPYGAILQGRLFSLFTFAFHATQELFG
jgi:hypothetical protein